MLVLKLQCNLNEKVELEKDRMCRSNKGQTFDVDEELGA